MTCNEAGKRLVEGRTDDAQLREHLAGCPDCARMAGLLTRLSAAGAAMRTYDLSPETIRLTRARVVEALAAQRAGAAAPVGPWLMRRPMLAAAAVVLLCAGTALFFMPRSLPEHPTAAELAMQSEILELRCGLMDRLDEFRDKYRALDRGSQFGAFRARLQDRLGVCRYELNRDLVAGRTEPSAVGSRTTTNRGEPVEEDAVCAVWLSASDRWPAGEWPGVVDFVMNNL